MRALIGLLLVALALVAVASLARFEYAPTPYLTEVMNPDRHVGNAAYDLFGRQISHDEARSLQQTPEGRQQLTLANGAIALTEELREAGRRAFYQETFGNEYFMTDVLGMMDGALSPYEVARAIVLLGGRGTHDLKVRLAEDVQLGDRRLARGTLISTGIDVPRGWFVPLGIKISYDRGKLRMGAACALCHSTVDPASGRVVEGAPNNDLNIGLLLALGSNSSAYLGHVTFKGVEPFVTDRSKIVTTSTGEQQRLPDPAELEPAVDAMLAAWAPGNFDSTPDAINNPTQIPDSFTSHDHPFGWTGFAAIGPFRGLNVLNNNVHGLNADMTTVAHAAEPLFNLDPEVYLGILLQNSANPRFRWDPASGMQPTAFLQSISPNPEAPGFVETVRLPTFPDAALIATHSQLASKPGFPLWHHINAMSAFQDSLLPPPAAPADPQMLARGRQVFEAAGCAACHSGPGYSNNQVLPVDEVGAQPSRAKALEGQARILRPSVLYPLDTIVPVQSGTPANPVPMTPEAERNALLGFAADGRGGYKVKGLIGLAWTAPYLHEGGVAVGPDADNQLGLPGTVMAGVLPDPANSLRALIDRGLRGRVVAANLASPANQMAHATGQGHEQWVDQQSGYTRDDQDALIAYLLSLTRFAEPTTASATGG